MISRDHQEHRHDNATISEGVAMTDLITLTVPGMTCGHCETSVTTEVSKVPGVASVDVDLGTKLVTVTGSDLDRAALVEAIDEAGFDVSD
jgi:copper chaperone